GAGEAGKTRAAARAFGPAGDAFTGCSRCCASAAGTWPTTGETGAADTSGHQATRDALSGAAPTGGLHLRPGMGVPGEGGAGKSPAATSARRPALDRQVAQDRRPRPDPDTFRQTLINKSGDVYAERCRRGEGLLRRAHRREVHLRRSALRDIPIA